MTQDAPSIDTPFYEAIRRHRNAISVLAHIILFSAAFFVACGMLNNFWRFDVWVRPLFLKYGWIAVGLKLIVFGAMGLHRGFWRYVGIRDAVQAFKASTWSS